VFNSPEPVFGNNDLRLAVYVTTSVEQCMFTSCAERACLTGLSVTTHGWNYITLTHVTYRTYVPGVSS